MEKSLAIDFLLFSVIGASSENDCDEILEASIRRAYQDASGRVGYLPKNGKDAATGKITSAIKGLKANNQKAFNEWHVLTCEEILPEDDEGYGKAQKWLNMSLKYLAVTYAVLQEKQEHPYVKFYEERLKSRDKYFHIPIDSYICDALIWAEAVNDEKNNPIPLKDNKGRRKKKLSEYANPYSDYIKSWSTWNDNDYKNVANYLSPEKGDKIYDLDWETQAWIKTARYRSLLNDKNMPLKNPGKMREDLKESIKSISLT